MPQPHTTATVALENLADAVSAYKKARTESMYANAESDEAANNRLVYFAAHSGCAADAHDEASACNARRETLDSAIRTATETKRHAAAAAAATWNEFVGALRTAIVHCGLQEINDTVPWVSLGYGLARCNGNETNDRLEIIRLALHSRPTPDSPSPKEKNLRKAFAALAALGGYRRELATGSYQTPEFPDAVEVRKNTAALVDALATAATVLPRLEGRDPAEYVDAVAEAVRDSLAR